MNYDLFNEKTIKRLCSNVKITPQQKKTAQEWLKLLESKVLEKERKNYFKFAGYVLEDLLGYSLRKDLDHEQANIEFSFKDSKGQTVLCIEVKGESKDLFTIQSGYKKEQETPFKQTWDNMGRIVSIKYGICTNYKDFILIDKSKGYSRYHFFDFLSIKEDEEKLKEFIAIFSKDNIMDREFLEKLYEESVVEEREFTKQFYKLFHETRLMMIKEFQDNGASREESIHFAQIFLNRLMFVFFAKDTGKLERKIFEDLVLDVLKTDNILSDQSKIVSDVIVSLFHRLNEGSESPYPIYGFNGGLFKEPIPPKMYFKDFRKKSYFKEIYQYSTLKKEIELDDYFQVILKKYKGVVNPIILNILYMSRFDFNTEVSVNILGHILEQSISDLEELKEEKTLRRKKEGVYYTHDYITDYICRNTIIPYLSKKGVNSIDKLIDEYEDDIEDLEEKFKNLKILDPACGSGSFLIKAVEVLLEIYKEIQMTKQIKGEYTAKKSAALKKWQKRGVKSNSQLTLFKWNEENEAKKIIENNIFGVDINEESVEITKLSLFLKIVQKNRKLIDLSKNIKCGNSLIVPEIKEFLKNKYGHTISEEEIEKYIQKLNPFDWRSNFPDVVDKKNFNIVIGNPPWGAFFDTWSKEFLKSQYKHATSGKIDSYKYFYEKSFGLVSSDGYISMITPNTFLYNIQSKNLRVAILNNFFIKEGIELRKNIFSDAPDVVPAILILKSLQTKNDTYKTISKVAYPDKPINDIFSNKWMVEQKIPVKIFFDDPENKINLRCNVLFLSIKEKMEKNPVLGDFFLLKQGTKPHGVKDKKPLEIELLKKNVTTSGWDKAINGRNIGRYQINYEGDYVLRSDKLHSRLPDYIIDAEKIYFQRMRKISLFPRIVATYDDGSFHGLYTCSVIFPKEGSNLNLKYILCLLNSLLINLWYKYYDTDVEIKLVSMSQIPVVELSPKSQQPFIDRADLMLKFNRDFLDKKNKFLNRVKQNLNLEKITNKLNNFYEFDFNNFLGELSKQGIELYLKQQDEWEDYFNEYKKELTDLKTKKEKIDGEIDLMVYDLYDLKENETNIVNNIVKENLKLKSSSC